MEDYTDIASRLASVGIVGNAKGGEFDVVDIKNYINGVVEPQTSPSPFVPYPLGFLARQSAGALVELINQTSRPKKTMLVGPEKFFSSTALDALTPITLREMYCPQIHKGKYVVCRVVYPTARDIAAEIFVEDFNGDVTLVCAEYIPGLFQANASTLNARFPIGTVFAIREPVMRGANNSGAHGMVLLVDSPSDIVILAPSAHSDSWKTPSPDHGLMAGRSALDWKAEGNTLFRERLFIPAVIAWSHALEIDPSLIAIPLNRALAYLSLKWYGAAYSDASLALDMTPSETDTFKANYRMACAEYGLGMYRVALDHFRSLRDHPMALNVDDWMKRCIDRAKEQEKGDYDWLRMFHCANGRPVDLDVADYVSPSITVTPNPKRESGRGISAIKEIKAGELLMVANPFAIMRNGELDKTESLLVLDTATYRGRTTSVIGLVSRVVARMLACPKDAVRITGQYAGPKHSPTPSDYVLTPAPDHIAVNPLVAGIDIDISRVEAVVSRHGGMIESLGPATNGPPPAAAADSQSSALYTSPNVFNHACHSNTARKSFGSVMVIRATENIAPGTEITLSLCSEEKYSVRQQSLRRCYQEFCDCVLCETDRADGEAAHERREGIYAEYIALIQRIQWHLDSDRSKAINLLEAARASYSGAHILPRPFLANIYMHAMHTLDQQGSERADRGQVIESIKYGFQSLEAIGFKGIDTRVTLNNRRLRFFLPLSKDWLGHPDNENASIMAMIIVALSFVWLSEVPCAERWFRAAWWAHDAYYGGGKALFDARWGAITSRLVGPEYARTEYRWK